MCILRAYTYTASSSHLIKQVNEISTKSYPHTIASTNTQKTYSLTYTKQTVCTVCVCLTLKMGRQVARTLHHTKLLN